MSLKLNSFFSCHGVISLEDNVTFLPIFQEIQKIYYQWKKQIQCFIFYFSTLYSLFDYALMITATIYWAPTVCQTLDVHNINQFQYFCKVGIFSWGNWGLEKMSVVLTLKFRIKDHLMIKRKKRDKKNIKSFAKGYHTSGSWVGFQEPGSHYRASEVAAFLSSKAKTTEPEPSSD